MIRVAGKELDAATLSGLYPASSLEGRIAEQMSKSSEVYDYESIDQLKFELRLRNSIVNASKELDKSSFAFKVFRKSKCNHDFWKRTDEGGFLLQSGVKPSDAIRDIFTNSSQYGTECSTAMVIVYYKALLDILPEDLFNKMFSDIYLMNWQHLDSDLGLTTFNKPADYLPGDARYFKNPDVDPLTPEWQGENVFDLGGGRYYGHGIGITDADRIIHALNGARIESSHKSAYLMETAERLNSKNLAKKYYNYTATPPAAPAASEYQLVWGY
jgi:protein-glutamine gamma-glutamyltransferase